MLKLVLKYPPWICITISQFDFISIYGSLIGQRVSHKCYGVSTQNINLIGRSNLNTYIPFWIVLTFQRGTLVLFTLTILPLNESHMALSWTIRPYLIIAKCARGWDITFFGTTIKLTHQDHYMMVVIHVSNILRVVLSSHANFVHCTWETPYLVHLGSLYLTRPITRA